jgi:MoxR-like ATPase
MEIESSTIQRAAELLERLQTAISQAVVGQSAVIEQVVVSLAASGHVLIEGVPGLGKTLLVRALAQALSLTHGRVQFTPDMMPSDIIGHAVLDPTSRELRIVRGPVFTQVLLADEINRAPAKVQSALLEVMQERQVTIGHTTYPVPEPFLAMATQNPIESEGTYPLPEAQIDRFMLKILIGYPSHDEELTIVQRQLEAPPQLRETLTLDDLRILQRAVFDVYIDPGLISYAVTLADATRNPADHGLAELGEHISFGASPRGPISLVQSARALALMHGRDYAVVDDLRALAKDALRHRLVLSYQALAEEVSADAILDRVLEQVPVPQVDLTRMSAA